MKEYFETFGLVELNNTFYQYPQERAVTGWREKALKNFEFTVKAHEDISHKARFQSGRKKLPSPRAYESNV